MTTARCARRYVPPATDFQRLIDAIEANDELAIEVRGGESCPRTNLPSRHRAQANESEIQMTRLINEFRRT